MVIRDSRSKATKRQGSVVAEFALLAPLLALLFVVGIDFSRLFYYSLTIQTCARNGALWGCDPTAAALTSPYTSVTQAALADAGNISPTPTVTSTSGTDGDGNSYIEVSVSYTFHTITNYPLVPSTINLVRTVRMRMVAAEPTNFN
jgi:Flp pilus assembly protein TadG